MKATRANLLVLCQTWYVANSIGVAISRLPQADREISFPMLDMTLVLCQTWYVANSIGVVIS